MNGDKIKEIENLMNEADLTMAQIDRIVAMIGEEARNELEARGETEYFYKLKSLFSEMIMLRLDL